MTTRIHQPGCILPKLADGALATAYTLVKLKTSDPARVQATAATGDPIFGILQERTASAAGDPVEVATEGVSLCKVDGSGTAIAAGDYLMAGGTAGVAVKLAGAAGTLRPVIGQALAASTVSGDLISVKISLSVAQGA